MKKQIIALSVALVMSCLSVQAAPHWYKDKKWWAGTAVIVAANVLDMQSTCRAFRNGDVEEWNFILRGTQSCGKILALGTSFTVFNVGLHALAWHCESSSFEHGLTCYGLNQNEGEKHRAAWETFTYSVIPTINVLDHLPAAIHNYELPRNPVR